VSRRPATARRWLRRVLVLLAVLAVALLLRTFVVSSYYIPSASMEPTLHGCSGCDDDHVVVNKIAYDLHAIHRGDVVVFHRPRTWDVPDTTLIKRVVGVPGDHLAVRGGALYVNGLRLREPYLQHSCPGMSSLAEPPRPPATSYGPVPAGTVFVLGDNRCDSTDSRAFGPVPDSDVVGRAFAVVWPVSRWRTL
jgi:signal peptidase I